MKRSGAGKIRGFVMLALATSSAPADTRHSWRVASPDHEQTFAYGTERIASGRSVDMTGIWPCS